jgi:hypothetical protein
MRDPAREASKGPEKAMKRSLGRRVLRGLSLLLLGVVILCFGAWASFAIYFSNLPWERARTVSAWAFGIGSLAAFVLLPNRRRTLWSFLAGFTAVLVWWVLIPARDDRDWLPECARFPRATIAGDRVTVHNVRNFDYRSESDFDERWEDRTYELSKLHTMDFIKSDWGLGDVAHTMLSFGFEGGEHLVLSIETRREKGEIQTAFRGLFKQYELAYILGDERDLLRLRTNFRGENVWLYPTKSAPEEIRVVFLDVLETVSRLSERPAFYNTLTHNCTIGLLPHLGKARPLRIWDIRLLLNGHTDEKAWEGGWINPGTGLSFEETRARCHINQYVGGDSLPADYSLMIRPHLRKG